MVITLVDRDVKNIVAVYEHFAINSRVFVAFEII